MIRRFGLRATLAAGAAENAEVPKFAKTPASAISKNALNFRGGAIVARRILKSSGPCSLMRFLSIGILADRVLGSELRCHHTSASCVNIL
jgi:hypothetical protein